MEFQCARGHVFKEAPGAVVYRNNKTCRLCRFYVCHDDSESTVLTQEDLQPIVDALIANQSGSIMLTPVRDTFPMIQAFVSGQYGHLDYWPTDHTTMHVATGMTPEDCSEVVHFQYSREKSDDGFEAQKALVVPAEVACDALFEFLTDGSRPDSVNWVEL